MAGAMRKRAKLRPSRAILYADTEIDNISHVSATEDDSRIGQSNKRASNGDELNSLDVEGGSRSSSQTQPQKNVNASRANETNSSQGTGTSKGRVRSNRGKYKGLNMAKKSKSINEKLLVYFPPGEENYEPVGPNGRRLSMWLGYCVRSVTEAPLYGWKSTIVPQYNTQLWNMVIDYFDVSPDSPPKLKKLEELHNTPSSETFEVKQFKFRTHCFHVMKESYRKWKSRLRIEYKKFDTDEERMQNITEGLTTKNWEKMLQVFASKEFVELSDRNSKNRANQTLVACTGPVTFAQVNYDMIDEETGEEPLASEAWMAQHATMNDNNEPQWVNNESFLAYQQIRRVEEEVVPVNPNVNVLKEAFKTRSGRIPGTGTGCKSKRQASINTQAGKVVELEAQLAAVTTRLEEHAQRNQELTTRLEDQGRHNLLLNQRFEKLMEMVESQQHMPSSSEDTQSEDTLSWEERVEEEFEREQRYLKVMNLNRKRISPTKKSSAPKKKK